MTTPTQTVLTEIREEVRQMNERIEHGFDELQAEVQRSGARITIQLRRVTEGVRDVQDLLRRHPDSER